MSLEEALNKNTAALIALTAAMGKGGGAAATTTTKASDAAIAAAAAKATGGKGKAKPLDLEAVKKVFGDYMATEDKEVRKVRVAQIKTILTHFDAPKASEIAEENWVEAVAALEAYKRGEEPELGGGEDEDDGEASLV
jgi:hypothetical protein